MANHALIYLDGDPTLRKRFKAHVVEVGVGALSGIVGGIVAVGAMIAPQTYAATALAMVPTAAVVLLGVVHMIAGIAVLAGLLITRRDIDVEIHLEQAGWVLACVGWLGFGWCMYFFAAGSTVGVTLGAVLGIVSGLRAWFLDEVEEQARERARANGKAA